MKAFFLALVVSLLLAACGGGESEETASVPAEAAGQQWVTTSQRGARVGDPCFETIYDSGVPRTVMGKVVSAGTCTVLLSEPSAGQQWVANPLLGARAGNLCFHTDHCGAGAPSFTVVGKVEADGVCTIPLVGSNCPIPKGP